MCRASSEARQKAVQKAVRSVLFHSKLDSLASRRATDRGAGPLPPRADRRRVHRCRRRGQPPRRSDTWLLEACIALCSPLCCWVGRRQITPVRYSLMLRLVNAAPALSRATTSSTRSPASILDPGSTATLDPPRSCCSILVLDPAASASSSSILASRRRVAFAGCGSVARCPRSSSAVRSASYCRRSSGTRSGCYLVAIAILPCKLAALLDGTAVERRGNETSR